MSVMTEGWIVSAGPAPMPLSTQAPIKEPYDCALARHIVDAKQMICEMMYTGRRPQDVLMGTLRYCQSEVIIRRTAEYTHQTKLLKPRTRIQLPVNLTTLCRSESKSFI